MGIRYVSLSDMHLGAKNSVLTNLKVASSDTDPLTPSPVLEQLVECLKALVGTGQDGRRHKGRCSLGSLY